MVVQADTLDHFLSSLESVLVGYQSWVTGRRLSRRERENDSHHQALGNVVFHLAEKFESVSSLHGINEAHHWSEEASRKGVLCQKTVHDLVVADAADVARCKATWNEYKQELQRITLMHDQLEDLGLDGVCNLIRQLQAEMTTMDVLIDDPRSEQLGRLHDRFNNIGLCLNGISIEVFREISRGLLIFQEATVGVRIIRRTLGIGD